MTPLAWLACGGPLNVLHEAPSSPLTRHCLAAARSQPVHTAPELLRGSSVHFAVETTTGAIVELSLTVSATSETDPAPMATIDVRDNR